MSSVRRGIVQNLTRTFVVTQNSANNEQGAHIYHQSDIDAWLAANGSKIVQTGSVFIIPGTASGSTFIDVVTGQNGATELDHSGSYYDERKSLKDLGKEIVIGNRAEPRLLVLRLVQSYALSANGGRSGDPDYTGYTPVENNCEDLNSTRGRFLVRIARI